MMAHRHDHQHLPTRAEQRVQSLIDRTAAGELKWYRFSRRAWVLLKDGSSPGGIAYAFLGDFMGYDLYTGSPLTQMHVPREQGRRLRDVIRAAGQPTLEESIR